MKFSNFKPLGSRFAEIDITTGMWWWKRTMTVMIEKPTYYKLWPDADRWYFSDSGEWCPPAMRECEREYYRSKHE